MFAGGVEVDESAGAKQPVKVLGQAAIADPGEAEAQLHHAEDVLDPRSRSGLLPVLFADIGVADFPGAIAPVDPVFGLRSTLSNDPSTRCATSARIPIASASRTEGWSPSPTARSASAGETPRTTTVSAS
jgi:hypothetical protein